MGRASVRQVAVDYFTSANIPYLGTVFPARPLVIAEEDYDLAMSGAALQQVTSVGGSACVMVVNLPDTETQRAAMSGRAFRTDERTHDVVLEVFFANTAGDGLQAQQDHDTVMDAIEVAIRADPLLGSPQVVFSAGEFRTGVHITQHEPFTGDDGTTVFITGHVRFSTMEWVSGPAGT